MQIDAQQLMALTQEQRRVAIADLVSSHDLGRDLFLTELLLLRQPLQTEAIAALRGHRISGGTQQLERSLIRDLPKVRVMIIEGKQERSLRYKHRVRKRIPATNESHEVGSWESLQVDDELDNGDALYVLRRWGYPKRNAIAEDGTPELGQVVEVAWLVAEAKKADAHPDIVALFEKLRPRIEGKNSNTQPGRKAQ